MSSRLMEDPMARKIIAKDHSHKTPLGDSRLPKQYRATYSQLLFGIGIKRSGWGISSVAAAIAASM